MQSILLFYLACFITAFFTKIPAGPVNVELLNYAVKKYHPQAFSVAVGAALGDGIWVVIAFMGITPFLANRYLEASLLLFTAAITCILGLSALKNSKFIERTEEEIIRKIRKKKRWAFLKGFSLILINPLVFISWMIALSFLRKFKIYIPPGNNFKILLFLVVACGTLCYFSLVVVITRKIKNLFNPERTAKIVKVLGSLLLVFSLYFLYLAIRLFFFNAQLIVTLTD